jgi:excisionase family DNA binding protein
MTVEEAAAYLGIARGSAYAAARAGQLPVVRIGRRLVVPRIALDLWLTSPIAEPGAGHP